MSKVYAIATDAICQGKSVRDSYMVVRAPFEDEESAINQIDEVISELEEKYKCFEMFGDTVSVKSIDEKTKVIVVNENGIETPVMRCTVLGVDLSTRTSIPASSFLQSGHSKKSSAEQKHQKQLLKKITQFVATLTPNTLNSHAVQG